MEQTIEKRQAIIPEEELQKKVDTALITGRSGQKECLWMKMGMVSHRLCTRNYDCPSCEFDQMMAERMSKGDSAESIAALERLKELPGNQRLCRYSLRGEISYRICSRGYNCTQCEFGQAMEEIYQQRLNKLAVRREAMLKKEDQKVRA